uniref:Uncharacterized protein n=1 Tax=Mus musculus TaxID=10090 RepID=Q9D3T0_MOUSE|nr:unnamed protein product [Mus musculus]
MTWSLPDGSLISGFHSEASFWEQSAGRTEDTREVIPYIELRGTWTGNPGRWCCWQCRCILQHLCTGCSSGSRRTHEHGCEPPCAHPESARRKGTASDTEVKRACKWETSREPRSSMGVEGQSALSHTPIHSLSYADSAQVLTGCMEMQPPLLFQGKDQEANTMAPFI